MCLVCLFGSSEPMVNNYTTIVLGERLGLRRAVRCAASPRVAGKLALSIHRSPPCRRLVAQVGGSPLPREGVDVGERRLPGVECVWPVGKVVSRRLVTFLIDQAPSKSLPHRDFFLPSTARFFTITLHKEILYYQLPQ